MKKIIDTTRSGWDCITDIACPISDCPGELRWAEAGYVPGYRICDCCGSHFALAEPINGPAGGLKCVRRLKPSARKTDKMLSVRKRAAEAEVKHVLDWRARQTAAYEARWTRRDNSVHGAGSVEIPSIDPDSASAVNLEGLNPEYRAVVLRCHAITRALREAYAREECADTIAVVSATRDGKAVMVYEVSAGYGGPLDGWWHTDALESVVANKRTMCTPPAGAKLTREERVALEVFR